MRVGYIMLYIVKAVILLAFASNLLATAPVPKPPQYMPTSIGSKWVYKKGNSECTEIISSVEHKKDGIIITISSLSNDNKTSELEKLLVTEKGLFTLEDNGSFKYDTPIQVLQLPFVKDASWRTNIDMAELKVSTSYKCTAEEIKVPAGTYQTIRVDWEFTVNKDTTPGRATYWYAQDVGVVKFHSGYVTKELKSFTPGAK
jgi:hypothetical protein